MHIRVAIFSNGGEFRPVSNFTELHALTLAAHSYAFLFVVIQKHTANNTAAEEGLRMGL